MGSRRQWGSFDRRHAMGNTHVRQPGRQPGNLCECSFRAPQLARCGAPSRLPHLRSSPTWPVLSISRTPALPGPRARNLREQHRAVVSSQQDQSSHPGCCRKHAATCSHGHAVHPPTCSKPRASAGRCRISSALPPPRRGTAGIAQRQTCAPRTAPGGGASAAVGDRR